MSIAANRQNIEDIYPLSPLQQGMLFHSLYAPHSGAYVIQVSFTLCGDLNLAAFSESWQYLVNRHSILRTAFVWENLEKPLQVVGKQVKCPIVYLDWKNNSPENQQNQFQALLEEQRQQGFNLSKAPLIQVTIIQQTDSDYQILWCYHHLLLDGWSMPILLQEFLKTYYALAQGENPYLPPVAPYRHYIAWLQKQNYIQAREFWQQKLANLTPSSLLRNIDPDLGKQEKIDVSNKYIEQSITLTPEQTEKLHIFAKQQKITINTLVKAAFALLLSHYSGESDIIFGSVCAGRPASLDGIESMVGMFVNTLPLRVNTAPQEKLYPWLKALHQQQIEIGEYEYSSLIDIHRGSGFSPNQPLFDSLVVFENYPSPQQQSLGKIQIRNLQITEQTNYPLTLYAVIDSQLNLKLLYDSDRFRGETIQQLLQQLKNILLEMISQGDCTLAEINLLPPQQQQEIFSQGRGRTQALPNYSISELITTQALRTPDATAITYVGETEIKTLTYGELNAKVNQIAYLFQAKIQQLGLSPSTTRVGVYLQRSPFLIISLLGILKTGATYVPLDPTYPQERIKYICKDAQISLLITQSELENSLPASNAEIIYLDQLELAETSISPSPPFPSQLAYIIYTSGSTGQPKGVMVEMRSLVNLLTGLQAELAIKPTDKLLAVTTIAFDIAALELFLPLISGAEVVLTQHSVTIDPNRLATVIEEQQITVMQATPATWRLLFANNWKGKADLKVLCGGENLDKNLAQQLLATNQEVWNLYGPTETTIWSAAKKLVSNQPVTIGHPIVNTQFYVLNQYLQPVPTGVPGELYIGGMGVARGYWQKPDLTAERFIKSPFSPNTLIYKTGDRVRYLPNGDVQYIGRLDYQVKIRGFRIELGEIEAVLQEHPEVSQAVVNIFSNNSTDKRLIAYLLTANYPVIAEEKLVQELRTLVNNKLPAYMMPSGFFILDKFPLTPNGKINRQALPAPDEINIYSTKTALLPQSELEQKIAETWQELLGINKKISIHDNFFDLGGDSLSIVRMQGKIKEKFKQEIPLVELFRHPTIHSLATYLNLEENSHSIHRELESRIEQIQTGKQRLLQKRQQIN